MVTCILYGRLGNQMFQVAATIGYALQHDIPYHIPADTLNNEMYPPYFRRMSKEPKRIEGNYIHYQEPHHHFTEIPFNETWRETNILLQGYFQSYKYFDHHREQVIKALDIPTLILKDYVAIHVRRDDYLTHPTKHPVVTLDYLAAATEYFKTKGHKYFKVYSDDMRWCMDNLTKLNCHFTFMEDGNVWRDLTEMVSTPYKIIANSSFSWWAAYLNNEIVVTPHEDNWFGPDNKHLDVKDLLPPDWIRIKY